MAGHQEQEHHRDQLVLGETVACLLRLDERRQQPIARVRGLPPDLVAQVAHRVPESAQAEQDAGSELDAAEARRPAREVGPVLRWEAEQLADDGERKGAREVREQIDPSRARDAGGQAVGRLVGQDLQPRAQGLDAPYPEGAIDEVAEPAMIRLVAEEHVGRQGLQRPRQPAEDRPHPAFPAVAGLCTNR